MKHAQYKEWLHLSVIDELNDEAQQLLDVHLSSCADCRDELIDLQKFQSVIIENPPIEITDRLLQEARRQLRSSLLEHRLRKSLWERGVDLAREIIIQGYRTAFGGIATAALGLFVGFLIFYQPQKSDDKAVRVQLPLVEQAMQSSNGAESFTQGSTRTSDLHLITAGGTDGTVEFTFEAVTPMHVRGNINDDKVQKILARALVNEENAGVRLQTVNAIASQVPDKKNPDPQVKTALISALKSDQNPGVRQEALRVLLRYSLDDEIKQALVYTLTHDKNSGMRIAAINGLAAASVEGHHFDQDILTIIKQKMDSDKNNYVRRQARTVMEEVAHR
ncbi:MAG: HEAT repeat domain-containing protein [Bacteroidota bacterium]